MIRVKFIPHFHKRIKKLFKKNRNILSDIITPPVNNPNV